MSLVTDGDLVPLEDFLAAQGPWKETPEVENKAPVQPKTATSKKYSQQDLEECGWLAQEQEQEASKALQLPILEVSEEDEEDALWAKASKGKITEEDAQAIWIF